MTGPEVTGSRAAGSRADATRTPDPDTAADPDAVADRAPGPVPLTEPRDGVPAPVATPAALAEAVARLAAGTGPVA
ncbi:MAG TPA: hypothetical protein VNC79_04740, partial [Mycobacteriales bacterium]|nr:hypothetical protein [Mycobacteriales bacterium]